ncbi:MAG TPA: hypothetical protein PK095_18565, partial [Myxococcota bacterium]|nr:hypothetical protein [Myxococcota bacterium]
PDAAPDTVADASVDTVPDAAPDVVLVGGCAEGQLERCAYPRRGLEVEVREGIATVEPVTGRTLPIKARLPQVAGPLPVVIWSHGGGFY